MQLHEPEERVLAEPQGKPGQGCPWQPSSAVLDKQKQKQKQKHNQNNTPRLTRGWQKRKI
jgi:hypothetical protein